MAHGLIDGFLASGDFGIRTRGIGDFFPGIAFGVCYLCFTNSGIYSASWWINSPSADK